MRSGTWRLECRRDQSPEHDRRQVAGGGACAHKLAISFGIANVFKRQIEAGEPYDLAIMAAAVTDDLIKQGQIIAATRPDVARGGIGIALRAGAPKSAVPVITSKGWELGSGS